MDTIGITKHYDYSPQSAEMQLIVDILHHAAVDPVERKKIEDEQEAWRTFDALSGGLLTKTKQNQKQIQQLETELEQKNKLIEELSRKLNEK